MGLAAREPRRVPANDRKFVFVFAPGGWDTTRVFADGLDNPNVDMEALANRQSVGDCPGFPIPRVRRSTPS